MCSWTILLVEMSCCQTHTNHVSIHTNSSCILVHSFLGVTELYTRRYLSMLTPVNTVQQMKIF